MIRSALVLTESVPGIIENTEYLMYTSDTRIRWAVKSGALKLYKFFNNALGC